MISKVAGSFLKFFQVDSKVDKERLEICRYGMEILISTLINMISIMVIGVIGGAWQESILFLICFSFLRKQTGGFHAGSYLTCNLSLIFFYSILVWGYQSTVGEFGWTGMIIIYCIHFLIWYLFMPIENENKPLSDVQKKRARKYSFVISIAYAMLSAFCLIWNFRDGLMLTYSVILTDILALISIIKGKRRIFKNEKRKSNQQIHR